MVIFLNYGYSWVLNCLMEYCDYFRLVKSFQQNESNQQKEDLELVEDNVCEIISKWHGASGKIGVKNDYVCNHHNHLSLHKYNNFFNIDENTDILFYKNDKCMFFTMYQERISYMADDMYEFYKDKTQNASNEDMLKSTYLD